jgi:hypothetical protein
MSMRPTLAKLPQTDLADVASQLRRLADWVERSSSNGMSCVIVIGTADYTSVSGFGLTPPSPGLVIA